MTPTLTQRIEAVARAIDCRHATGADSLTDLADTLRQIAAEVQADTARLDYIERTFSGMTNRERYLPVQMIWGKGCNGRTLREACDKYMARDSAALAAGKEESNDGK